MSETFDSIHVVPEKKEEKQYYMPGDIVTVNILNADIGRKCTFKTETSICQILNIGVGTAKIRLKGDKTVWTVKLEKIHPLLITPDILQGIGFELYEGGGDTKTLWRGCGEDCEDDVEFDFGEFDDDITLKIDKSGLYMHTQDVKYVHQAQHLFKEHGLEDWAESLEKCLFQDQDHL